MKLDPTDLGSTTLPTKETTNRFTTRLMQRMKPNMSIPETKAERDKFLLTHARAIFQKCISEDAASATAKSVMSNWLLLHEVAEIADRVGRRENQDESNGSRNSNP